VHKITYIIIEKGAQLAYEHHLYAKKQQQKQQKWLDAYHHKC
jgi:hypothetical protein